MAVFSPQLLDNGNKPVTVTSQQGNPDSFFLEKETPNLEKLPIFLAIFRPNVEVTRHGTTVGADSIMGLMMLAAGQGAEIEVSATGPDADAAVDALDDLLRRRFDED